MSKANAIRAKAVHGIITQLEVALSAARSIERDCTLDGEEGAETMGQYFWQVYSNLDEAWTAIDAALGASMKAELQEMTDATFICDRPGYISQKMTLSQCRQLGCYCRQMGKHAATVMGLRDKLKYIA